MNKLPVFLLLLLTTALCRAAEPLPAPTLVATLNPVGAATNDRFGTVEPVKSVKSDAPNADAPDGSAVCSTTQVPPTPWGWGLRAVVDRPIAKGEVLRLDFEARTLAAKTESGLASVVAYFEENGPPFDKSLNRAFDVGRERRTYSIPFRAAADYPAGRAAFGLFLGRWEQSIEISAVRLSSFGTDFDLVALPDETSSYPGREADAPWRKAALERIEKFRKADLTVSVVDADGRPLPNAAVEIRQTRSAFGWGTAVVASRILAPGPDGDRYRAFVDKYCSRVVFENDLKWFAWKSPRSREAVFKALDRFDERKIGVRGHCLVWPSWRNSDFDWRKLENDPTALAAAVREHIADETTALAGRLVDWDVVNEINDNNDLTKILGGGDPKSVDVLAGWFRDARAGDPNARLFINDYGLLSGEGLDRRKQDSYFATIRALLDAGAPIGGIGLQGHFGGRPTPPERLVEILDRFSELGLPLAITEHDVDASNERLQADFTRDVLTAAFACPAVDEFLIWGFWERAHWRPKSAYYRADWTPTPAGRVWERLVGEEWRTNVDATTDADGTATTRAFLGDYRVSAKLGDLEKTVETSVDSAGTNVEIRFDRANVDRE